ncbi:MAG TPA: LysR family transcriptional regulator [Polyangiaceae bacterium]|nr:LysR family transcriptional regulator [Polyangiaceae bacterium]
MESADANLLLALDALYQAGSVTGAARRMNLSPPAMSHTLSRLRLALGDPLFVRAGNRLVPTPRALALREPVSRVATEIAALLRPDLPLDIATLERTFVIRVSDATIVTVGHALDVLVRKEAPRVALHLVGVLLAETREADLDIGVQYGSAPDLRIQTLGHEEMVPVVRKDHPLAKRRLASARLATLEHIAVASQRAKFEELTKPRRSRRWRPPSRIVPSFLAAATLVRASDAYTVLPKRLAAAIEDTFGLCRLSVTGPVTKVAITQAWSPRFDNDAAHIWLRGCVRRAFGAAAQPS